jgi:hypothetical protein
MKTDKTVSSSLLTKWNRTIKRATLNKTRGERRGRISSVGSEREQRKDGWKGKGSLLQLGMLVRDHLLADELEHSSVDLVAKEVEDRVDDERSGLERSNATIRRINRSKQDRIEPTTEPSAHRRRV